MNPETSLWPQPVLLAELARSGPDAPFTRHLSADAKTRAAIAAELGLESLERLEADIRAHGWFDGAAIEGRWRAEVIQICGVSLEPFASALEGVFELRVVPKGSPHAGAGEREVLIDPMADDPPDELESDRVDLGGYLVEHLALEIDPFPRKPGAVFEPPAANPETSPFAVLRNLKTDGPKT